MTQFKMPVHEADVPMQTWYAGTDRELRGWALSDTGGPAKIGFGVLELKPGCNTLPAHYHTLEEEHIYVLEGAGTLHLGGCTYPLKKGTYINFPPGQEAYHFLSNDSDETLRYIIVGERIQEDRVHFES